ncbi:MAG: hypothetical protein HUU01_11185 [Saprospiraceae bacterium]|nr:hypothetical protein [Saprospiraceae bacterium]
MKRFKLPRQLPSILRQATTCALFCGLLFAPGRLSPSACDPNRFFYGYSFLSAELIAIAAEAAPFLMPFSTLERYYQGPEYTQANDNIREWHERYCQQANATDIHYLVYTAPAYELENLRAAIVEKVTLSSMAPELLNNSFARYLHRHKCTETIDYLLYAKQCEPYALKPEGWKEQLRTTNAMNRLIKEGRAQFMRTKSDYIRLRYAYQIIRLAHYLKDYEQTLELFDFLMPKIDHDPSIVEYWILGHKAGALLALGKNVEASYLYSRVYDRCPGKRESAYLSFRIKTDEEWEACLLMCQNDRERAALYALRASGEEARLIEEMQSIYNLYPKSEHLNALLIREVIRLERDLLGLDFNKRREQNRRYFGIPRKGADKRVIRLQAFVRQVLKDGNAPREDLWKLAEGYLELLAGDFYFAAKTFKEAGDLVESDTLQQQLAVFQNVLSIIALDSIDDAGEKAIAALKTEEVFRLNKDFPRFLKDRMAHLYRVSNHEGKAFLQYYPFSYLKLNPSEAVLDDLLRTTRKETTNRLERAMIEKEDGSTIENDLLDLRATMLLGEFRLEAALEVLKEMNREEWDSYGTFYPFVDRLNDCVHCRIPDSIGARYNRGKLIEELLELEYRAKAETKANLAAGRFYRIGTALYNMTYFGYSWKAADAYRSGASMQRRYLKDGDNVTPHHLYPGGNREVFDCSHAQFYFEKARILAEDPELAAKAAFMAAKCERNDYYVKSAAKEVPRTYFYFNILKENYSDTRFYAKAIRECKYFKAYASK